MLTKNVFLSSVAICVQVVKLIFNRRGVQLLCSMLSFDSAFFPLNLITLLTKNTFHASDY